MGLKLNINPTITYSGLAYFNPGWVQFTNAFIPSAAGGKTLEWKMWLDAEDNFNDNWLFQFTSNFGGDGFISRLDSSILEIIRNGQVSGVKAYSLQGLSGKILTCQIVKTTNSISSFKVNGVSQNQVTGYWAGASYNQGFYLSKTGVQRLINSSIWDIKIIDNDDNDKIIHSWKGYPNGNTLEAWVDDVSTMDAIYRDIPSTRNISGTGDISLLNNKLEISFGTGSKLLINTSIT